MMATFLCLVILICIRVIDCQSEMQVFDTLEYISKWNDDSQNCALLSDLTLTLVSHHQTVALELKNFTDDGNF